MPTASDDLHGFNVLGHPALKLPLPSVASRDAARGAPLTSCVPLTSISARTESREEGLDSFNAHLEVRSR